MATTTSRLSLHVAQRTPSDDYVNVTTDLNNNWVILDNNINAQNVTAATHPSNPYDGKFILETDTGYLRMWDASDGRWVIVGHDNFSKGYMVLNTSSSNGANAVGGGAEVGPYISNTFTAQADRLYAIEFFTHVEQTADDATAGSESRIRYRWAAGGSVANTDTLVDGASEFCITLTNNLIRPHRGFRTVAPGVNGTVTIGTFIINTDSASHTTRFSADGTTRNSSLLIRDIGLA